MYDVYTCTHLCSRAKQCLNSSVTLILGAVRRRKNLRVEETKKVRATVKFVSSPILTGSQALLRRFTSIKINFTSTIVKLHFVRVEHSCTIYIYQFIKSDSKLCNRTSENYFKCKNVKQIIMFTKCNFLFIFLSV